MQNDESWVAVNVSQGRKLNFFTIQCGHYSVTHKKKEIVIEHTHIGLFVYICGVTLY